MLFNALKQILERAAQEKEKKLTNEITRIKRYDTYKINRFFKKIFASNL